MPFGAAMFFEDSCELCPILTALLHKMKLEECYKKDIGTILTKVENAESR